MMEEYYFREPKFEIIKHYGIIGEGEDGMKRELNLISWNGEAPKYDIRCWNESRDNWTRGLTLTPDEMEKLIDTVQNFIQKS